MHSPGFFVWAVVTTVWQCIRWLWFRRSSGICSTSRDVLSIDRNDSRCSHDGGTLRNGNRCWSNWRLIGRGFTSAFAKFCRWFGCKTDGQYHEDDVMPDLFLPLGDIEMVEHDAARYWISVTSTGILLTAHVFNIDWAFPVMNPMTTDWVLGLGTPTFWNRALPSGKWQSKQADIDICLRKYCVMSK